MYALAPRGARVTPPLRTITVGSVSAIVRVAGRAPAASESAMRSHHRIVARVSGIVPAVLPVRFATTFDDVEELRFVLRARQQTVRRALAAVRGRVQMTTRFASGRPAKPESRRPTASGTDYLRARAAAATVPEVEPLRAAVRRWVRDERVENRAGVASVYHLVPRGSVPAYRRALAAAADAAGRRVLITGPFPPYAFSTPF